MNLPRSFTSDGFVTPEQAQPQTRRLPNGQILKATMISIFGPSDTGKTEFAMSIPGWLQMVSIDRGYKKVFDNPTPPTSRNPNLALKVIPVPINGSGGQTEYKDYFLQTKDAWYKTLSNPDSTVAIFDGESDYYELHTLGMYGKLTGIFPQVNYTVLYTQKRAQLARASDSGKIIVYTSKVKDEYETVYDEKGQPIPDPDKPNDFLRRRTGQIQRSGFKDLEYLTDIGLLTMFRPARLQKMGNRMIEVPAQFGVKIVKCKHNVPLVGTELWGDNCSFRGLVELAYPRVPLERWGY